MANHGDNYSQPVFWKTLLSAFTISGVSYLLFYHFAPVIWSFNTTVPIEEIAPFSVREAYLQRDGVESYVLYILMFINIASTIVLSRLASRLTGVGAIVLLAPLLLLSLFFIYKVGFNPPVARIVDFSPGLIVLLVCMSSLVACFSLTYHNFPRALNFLVIIFLLPVCFVSTSQISVCDYGYILDPALKLLNGARVSEIYFQYDLLLSLIAAFWIKAKLELNHFQILGQLSYFIFILAAYFFSKRFFFNKMLPIYLLISLVAVRLYGNIEDPVTCFQVTPLRLDLWLILLVLVYWKGVYHWLVGLYIGLLLLVSRTFGVIYLFSYLELAGALFIIEYAGLIIPGRNFAALGEIFPRHLKLNIKNLIIIAVSVMLSAVLFKGLVNDAAVLYRKMGLGFIPISPTSLYWYVPVLFSLTVALLIRFRNILPARYFSSGLFIVLLAIGNSVYFFGRSHGNNIINISGILLFSLFLFFDVLNFILDLRKENPQRTFLKRAVSIGLPVLFILLATYYYSGNLINRTGIKVYNMEHLRLIYPVDMPDFGTIGEITKGSPNVYFLSDSDIQYYYDGNFTPVGYYSPFNSWVMKRDLIVFLQDLLERHYFLVCDKTALDPGNIQNVNELLPLLKFNGYARKNGYLAVWKE